ncbi:hypothetical protein [Micromonospora sp. WMMD737]|uniref:hypothetical protein n=1 Tax=Micromonospora sp. WMMD737 TaxID=3404113 RepID=UPI003B924EFA
MTQTANRDAMPGGVPGGQPPRTATWAADAWHAVTGWLDAVPGWAWLALAGLLFVCLVVLRHRLDKAVSVTPPKTGDRLGGLFVTAVALAAGLWGCILAASGTNLLNFGRHTLGWHGGHEWLMIGGVDGIAVVFAVLMFAAARAGRPTHRAYRIVWSSTLLSAGIGVWQGWDSAHSLAAALVLGYFAVASMGVLHELLDLFRATTERQAPRVRPPFGLRWVTYFPHTLCAALAWENHPPRPLPADATDEQVAWYGSIRHACAHLETVRRAKRVARYRIDAPAGAAPAAGWARVWPWLRLRQLDTAIADQQVKTAAVLAEHQADAAAKLDAVRAEATRQLDAAHAKVADLTRQLAEANGLFETASAELDQATAGRQAAEARADAADRARATAETAADRTRLDAAGRVAAAEQTAADRAAQVDRLTRELNIARQEIGRIGQQLADARAATERAIADGRRQLAEQADRHAADLAAVADRRAQELTATTRRLVAEKDAAVADARAAAVAVVPVRHEPATATARGGSTETATPPAPAARGGDPGTATPPADAGRGGSQDRSPRVPPWSARQEQAFKLRDANPKKWTFAAIAGEVGQAESSVRRWFKDREKYAASPAAVPTTPIKAPKEPVTAGTNGTPIHTR